jgi:hypothetical protein
MLSKMMKIKNMGNIMMAIIGRISYCIGHEFSTTE